MRLPFPPSSGLFSLSLNISVKIMIIQIYAASIQNLVRISASKNLGLSARMMHTASRSIRERLLSYLSYQAQEKGSSHFRIPFSRQELADYLGVDRSALSSELGKMQRDGLLRFHKNEFCLERDVT